MKKSFIFLTMLSVVLLLSSCKSESYVTPERMAKQQSVDIMNSILDKDAEGIKELLCPYIKETHPNLDREIRELFDFVDGIIISYDDPEGSIGGGTIKEDGVSEQRLGGRIENIKTDAGRTYMIIINSTRINKENPEYVGITTVAVCDVDSYDEEKGYREYIICCMDEAE